MTVEISALYLLDGATGQEIAGELRDSIEDEQLVDWQTKWQPAQIAVLQELARRGVPPGQWPQSWHWDWRRKTAHVQGLLAFRGFCVTAQGVTQGLAQVDLNRLAQEPSCAGKPLVYLDYLEVAPWNRTDLGQQPRLRGVGTALLSAVVALSLEEGFKGRIGLHSLPQADDFYRRRCGMTDLGADPNYQNLRYFEMTEEQSRVFIEE